MIELADLLAISMNDSGADTIAAKEPFEIVGSLLTRDENKRLLLEGRRCENNELFLFSVIIKIAGSKSVHFRINLYRVGYSKWEIKKASKCV